MSSRPVFALTGERYELFLGYTSLDSDDGRVLAMDLLPRLSARRAAAWSELRARSLPIFVYARDLASGDRGANAVAKNYYLHDGEPYIHDLAVEDPGVLLADGETVSLELREADHALGVLLSTGGVVWAETEDGVTA